LGNEAQYIALALSTYICILSHEKIILGGGVMKRKHFFFNLAKVMLNIKRLYPIQYDQ
jgi:predicted NBD/HSP70 family sugar kinase